MYSIIVLKHFSYFRSNLTTYIKQSKIIFLLYYVNYFKELQPIALNKTTVSGVVLKKITMNRPISVKLYGLVYNVHIKPQTVKVSSLDTGYMNEMDIS